MVLEKLGRHRQMVGIDLGTHHKNKLIGSKWMKNIEMLKFKNRQADFPRIWFSNVLTPWTKVRIKIYKSNYYIKLKPLCKEKEIKAKMKITQWMCLC